MENLISEFHFLRPLWLLAIPLVVDGFSVAEKMVEKGKLGQGG